MTDKIPVMSMMTELSPSMPYHGFASTEPSVNSPKKSLAPVRTR